MPTLSRQKKVEGGSEDFARIQIWRISTKQRRNALWWKPLIKKCRFSMLKANQRSFQSAPRNKFKVSAVITTTSLTLTPQPWVVKASTSQPVWSFSTPTLAVLQRPRLNFEAYDLASKNRPTRLQFGASLPSTENWMQKQRKHCWPSILLKLSLRQAFSKKPQTFVGLQSRTFAYFECGHGHNKTDCAGYKRVNWRLC